MAGPAPDTAPAGPLLLRDEDVRALARTRGWVRFLGVFCLLMTFLLAALGLSFLAVGTAAMGPGERAVLAASLIVGVLVMGLWGILCWGYASGLAAFGRGQPGALVRAFRNLRRIWVLVVIGFALGPLVALAQILGFGPTKPP